LRLFLSPLVISTIFIKKIEIAYAAVGYFEENLVNNKKC